MAISTVKRNLWTGIALLKWGTPHHHFSMVCKCIEINVNVNKYLARILMSHFTEVPLYSECNSHFNYYWVRVTRHLSFGHFLHASKIKSIQQTVISKGKLKTLLHHRKLSWFQKVIRRLQNVFIFNGLRCKIILKIYLSIKVDRLFYDAGSLSIFWIWFHQQWSYRQMQFSRPGSMSWGTSFTPGILKVLKANKLKNKQTPTHDKKLKSYLGNLV